MLSVWEDVHWADPSTLELLDLVIEQGPTARLLTLMTARPEFRPPWTPRSYLTQLTLGRLPRPQVETMVQQLTDGKPLPAEVLEQVVAKTDGVPLFVEELVKMILESGLLREEANRYVLTGPLPPLAIPATLQDSLMARLDRLTTAEGWRSSAPSWGGSSPMSCSGPSRRWTRRRCSGGWRSSWTRNCSTSGGCRRRRRTSSNTP